MANILGAISGFLGPAGPIIGSVASGMLQRRGQSAANAANIAMAREQMQFQERMAGSAHQREVKDLALAGLNPILSGTGGAGSASPSGAMGVSQSEMEGFGGLGDAVSSAFQVRQLQAMTRKANFEASSAQSQASIDKIMAELTADNRKFLNQNFQSDARFKASVAKLSEMQQPSAAAYAKLWEDLGEGGEFFKALGAAMPTMGPVIARLLPLILGGKR